ncbi:MAG: hypothetical protein Q4B17_12260 [Lautropia sp.]|nr:hypothetical protein [Lautropia sp.]
MMSCDPQSGVCQVPETGAPSPVAQQPRQALTLHYIGDPMCSWCWGISPAVQEAAAWCEANGIGFQITVGGLRAGGGDAWNEVFKTFLRREWTRIASVTGQPFGYTLLDLPEFHYDTEPACRAVVCAQLIAAGQNADADTSGQASSNDSGLPLAFMSAVQRKFYVEGQDPKQVDFYASICEQLGVAVPRFSALFLSDEAREATRQTFARCRGWGVFSFPTLLIEQDGHLQTLSAGYTTAGRIIDALSQFRRSDDTSA